MPINLRDLIYMKNFPEEIKFKLLRIIDSSTWLEDLFDLIGELSEDREECNAPADCGSCEGAHLDHQCAYQKLYSDYKTTVQELDDKEIEVGNYNSDLEELRSHIGGMTVRVKYPDKKPEELEVEANEIAEYEDPLRELDEALRIYKERIQKGIKTMLTNVKTDLYGNSDPDAFNRYTSIKKEIDPLVELEQLIPEYLFIQKRKLMERIRSNSGLTVGNVELPGKIDI